MNDKEQIKFEVDYLGKKEMFLPEQISESVLSFMKKTAEVYLG